MSHTPEPWAYDEDTATIMYDGRGNATEGDRLGCVIGETRYRTDAARIVACVNACAGMADPAAEIERLRSGGCVREQGTTQFCGEAARLAQENLRLHAVAIQCEAEAVELRRAVDALALEVATLRELQREYGDGPLSKRGYAYVVRLNTDCVEAALDAVREQMPKACAMIAEAKARAESAQGGKA